MSHVADLKFNASYSGAKLLTLTSYVCDGRMLVAGFDKSFHLKMFSNDCRYGGTGGMLIHNVTCGRLKFNASYSGAELLTLRSCVGHSRWWQGVNGRGAVIPSL